MGDIAHGITLTGETTGLIGKIINVGAPSQSREVQDVTTMDSVDMFREKIPGLIDAGELPVTVMYDGAASGVAAMLQEALEAAPEVWTLVLPDASGYSGTAFVTALGFPSTEVGGKMTQDVTLTLSGKWTHNVATA